MFVRQLMYLAAVARERHFARAANSCHVSQPTLSSGIRKLEEELGVPVVVRGHRFHGLTPEGEKVLAWAHRIISDFDGLRQDLGSLRNHLTGRLRLGVIPAALPSVALLTGPFCAEHPAVAVQIQSLSSRAIERALEDFEIEAGLTYLDNEPLKNVRRLPLYREKYLFVTAADGPFGSRRRISWREAAGAALCLLTPDMQNRRIVDQIFHEVGVETKPHIETNSFVAMCSHVRFGKWSSILPHAYFYVFRKVEGIHAIPLVNPVRSHVIGLVTADRDPLSPLAEALIRCAAGLDLERKLENYAPLKRRKRSR
jgi:DNA-binding transcriptional LysR family regulator